MVLAWDETTPAVRALVEATEATTSALDSVVVLVPAETGEPTQEEYLPLAAEPTLPEAAEAAISPAEAPPTEPAEAPPLGLPSASPVPPTLSKLPVPGAPAALPPALAAALAPLAWSEVRVLRLSSFGLPGLTELSKQALPHPIWQSSTLLPAAPYLGSQPEVTSSEVSTTANQGTIKPKAAVMHATLPEDAAAPGAPTPSGATQPARALPGLAPDYLLAASPLPALDAEADLAPILPDELATAEAAPAETPSSAQASWSEALASLRTPLPIDEPTLAADFQDAAAYYAATAGGATGTGPTALRSASKPFAAPDLNFQVIQYARFAVPVALAQAPFSAIYAPAWPTWLAAQELRYRTRQPLVLHVATLAAGADQSIETATGWQAELQRQALHRADLILAETPELTRRLRHDLGLSPELVRTVTAADAAAVAQALRTARVRPIINPG
ncbi:glycosyltransferase [Hymenobacter bucti]|uniref:Glycosyltransferase n=1 Tax=Hymenobacter bucti TaxID=1844114 RepID=A0ABW4QRI0_9BACT